MVDDFNREVLAIEIDLNIPAQRVVRVLERIVANRGKPRLTAEDANRQRAGRGLTGADSMGC